MNTRRILELGGIAARVLMVAFGIGSLVLGIHDRRGHGSPSQRHSR